MTDITPAPWYDESLEPQQSPGERGLASWTARVEARARTDRRRASREPYAGRDDRRLADVGRARVRPRGAREGIVVESIGSVFLLNFVNYLFPLWDPDNETPHDKMCATRVVLS